MDFELRIITHRRAEWLGMAPKTAGGWVATDLAVRYTIERDIGNGRLLALLPATWDDGSRVPNTKAREIAASLEAAAALPHNPGADIARFFASQIRAHLATESP